MDKNIKTILDEADIQQIFKEEKESYSQSQKLDVKEVDNLLQKLTELFNYAWDYDIDLLTISNSKKEKWSKTQLEIQVEKTLSSLLTRFFNERIILKQVIVPLAKIMGESELEKIEKEEKYEDEFFSYLRENSGEIQITSYLDKITEIDLKSFVDNLYKKYKNNKIVLSKLVSLKKISQDSYTIESMEEFIKNKKSRTIPLEVKSEFIKELNSNLEYIYFKSNTFEESSDVVTEIRKFVKSMIEKYVTQRQISDIFSKIKSSGESDSAVDLIVKKFRAINEAELIKLKEAHFEFMSAENINGYLLESFLANTLEEDGWIWCSGEVYKSVDFCKINGSNIELLQVKNKYNSENSSSTKIRQGTNIKKWHRLNKESDNWHELHEILGGACTGELNESKYMEYIEQQFNIFYEASQRMD